MRRIKNVIWAGMISLGLALCVNAQAVTKCDHISATKERFENIAIRPPVNVTDYDGKTLSVVYRDRLGIYVEQYSMDKDSIIKLPKDYKGKYFWVMVDLCDKPNPYLYIVTPITEEQFVKNK
jgi:hypothetical protein